MDIASVVFILDSSEAAVHKKINNNINNNIKKNSQTADSEQKLSFRFLICCLTFRMLREDRNTAFSMGGTNTWLGLLSLQPVRSPCDSAPCDITAGRFRELIIFTHFPKKDKLWSSLRG